jgi:hypothetical protein
MGIDRHPENIPNTSVTQVGAGNAYYASSTYRHSWTLQLFS